MRFNEPSKIAFPNSFVTIHSEGFEPFQHKLQTRDDSQNTTNAPLFWILRNSCTRRDISRPLDVYVPCLPVENITLSLYTLTSCSIIHNDGTVINRGGTHNAVWRNKPAGVPYARRVVQKTLRVAISVRHHEAETFYCHVPIYIFHCTLKRYPTPICVYKFTYTYHI